MAGRQGATFQKRQREAKRAEKQRAKAEKRAARRLDKVEPGAPAGTPPPPVPGPGQTGPADPGPEEHRSPVPQTSGS
jgi:hypothetical protein